MKKNLRFLLQSFVSAEFSWENCHGVTHDIKLLNVTVTPHPVIAPGTVTIEITVQNEREIIAPVKVASHLFLIVLDRVIFSI